MEWKRLRSIKLFVLNFFLARRFKPKHDELTNDGDYNDGQRSDNSEGKCAANIALIWNSTWNMIIFSRSMIGLPFIFILRWQRGKHCRDFLVQGYAFISESS